MHNGSGSLVHVLLGLPVFRSEWVLYLLLGLSLVSVGVMLERWLFYWRRRVQIDAVRDALALSLERGDLEAAARMLGKHDALETNVVLVGLRAYEKGPEAVEDLMAGAEHVVHDRWEHCKSLAGR